VTSVDRPAATARKPRLSCRSHSSRFEAISDNGRCQHVSENALDDSVHPKFSRQGLRERKLLKHHEKAHWTKKNASSTQPSLWLA
jgi:hypothetical protein